MERNGKVAFFVECSGSHWTDAILILANEMSWKPALWTGGRHQVAAMMQRFPDIHAGVGVDLARGDHLPSLNCQVPADAEIMQSLSKAENLVMAMMGRMDATGTDFGYDERRRLYVNLVSYWSGVLETLRPDIVIFAMTPHLIYDYVIYELCRHYKVQTALFDRTAVPGYLLPMKEFDRGSNALHKRYLEKMEADSVTLDLHLEEHLAAQRGSSLQASANFAKKAKKHALNDRSLLRSASNFLTEFLRFISLLRKYRVPENYLKVADRPIATRPTLWQWQWTRLAGLVHKKRLASRWKRLSHEGELSSHFVYFAMHFQPERATTPSAGMWHDQITAIAALAHQLPTGWKLVIREHPWQLAWFSRGELGRNADYYNELSRLPNVVFSPAQMDPDLLLQKCVAIATMTGSLGWQAICKGKPAILFGDPWYKIVHGAYRVYSNRDIRAALDDIRTGFAPNSNAPRALLSAMDDVSARAVLEPSIEATNNIDFQMAGANMARSLSDLYMQEN